MPAQAAALGEAAERAGRLARRTSLGVGGRPRYLFEPQTEVEAAAAVRLCRAVGVRLLVLGGGCNLLVGEGEIDGAVIATRKLIHFRVHADRVEVGAGNRFPDLVRKSIDLGIPGLPGCPGIPGSVGGVVVMNAGGRFGSVADALLEATGLDAEGRPFRRAIRTGDLGYRRSPFDGCLVTGAVFRRDPRQTAEMGAALFHQAMTWKRETQPLAARSAGCIFKNPDGPRSAGWLIEAAGLKGRHVGGASVSIQHANFIVNDGTATADEVHALIRLVRAEVAACHGVTLALEVQTWAARR